MYPEPFELHRAVDVQDAVTALSSANGTAVLAGGLSLVPSLRARRRSFRLLVDIGRLDELATVRDEDGELVVGATARQDRVLSATASRPGHGLLAAALRGMGSPLVRRQGTVVGALAQADPALQLSAVASVLEPTVVVVDQQGCTRYSARELFGERSFAADCSSGPADLRASPVEGRLISQARFTALPPDAGWSFMQASRRAAGGLMGGVAALLALDARGRCVSVRLAPFVQGHDGSALDGLEDRLLGEVVDERNAERAARWASQRVRTVSDALASADYRSHLVRVLVRRSLLEAARRAG